MNKRKLRNYVRQESDNLHNSYMNDMKDHYWCKDIVADMIDTLDFIEMKLDNKSRWRSIYYKTKHKVGEKIAHLTVDRI